MSERASDCSEKFIAIIKIITENVLLLNNKNTSMNKKVGEVIERGRKCEKKRK